MKGPSVVAKNLKLLFRSKESAFTIIFGPLLIILLVSAAYTGSGDAEIRIGTSASEYTPLADKMITAFKGRGYLVSTFTNESECVGMIGTGELHTCVLFPDDFRVKQNETNVVTFAVDYSRINLVYQIIEAIASEFQVEGSAISEGHADTLLKRIALAQQEVHQQIDLSREIDADLQRIGGEISQGKTSLDSVETEVSFVDLLQIRGRVTGLASIVADMKSESIGTIDDVIDELKAVRSDAENETYDRVDHTIEILENATETLTDIADEAPDAAMEVSRIIDDAAASIRETNERFNELVNASEEASARLGTSKQHLDAALEKLMRLRGTLEHVDDSLQESLGMSASGVASPITTRIRSLNTDQDNLTFTYPYVLMLVIMFLGLMLNSTLIVMDKTSKAAFRNFTTATKDEYHILLSFITTFLILLAQVCIILLISYFFVRTPLFANFGVTLLIVAFAITLFSFLGMVIGYLSGTQEGAMIASLSVGSVLLFVSNLVLPIETMNRIVKTLSVYNPYVVLSELLKQSMLFDLKLTNVPGKLGLLILAIGLLFGLILAVQRSFKSRFFQRRSRDLAASAFAGEKKAVQPLLILDREVRDPFDLLEVLDGMTRAEFEQVLSGRKNPVALWVRTELGERSLSRKMDTRSKERMIIALDKYLKRKTKSLQRQQ